LEIVCFIFVIQTVMFKLYIIYFYCHIYVLSLKQTLVLLSLTSVTVTVQAASGTMSS